jgi:hypothetical protein
VTEPRFPEPLPIGATLADAMRLYRLLFARSVLVAGLVFAAITLVRLWEHVSSGGTRSLLALVASLSGLAGPTLVQGALVEIVRNVHEGRSPEAARRLFASAGRRFWPLVGASFVYVLGWLFGLLLLIVPGLVVFARWSLMPAVVMLEGRGVWDSRDRSSALVRGQTFEVFLCLFVSFVVIAGASFAILLLHVSFGTQLFVSFVWSALTAPFDAHLLTCIYYRRADPGRPVIHPAVRTWRSVWEGQ